MQLAIFMDYPRNDSTFPAYDLGRLQFFNHSTHAIN